MTTILILSCGTRNKLVRFFKEAFHSLPGGGRVIVTDCSRGHLRCTRRTHFIWYRR